MQTDLLVKEPLFDQADFPEPNALTDSTWDKLPTVSNYFFRVRFEQEVPAMLAPLVILAERSGIAPCRTSKSIGVILRWMVRRRESFWQCNQETWKAILAANLESRPYVAAVAYNFGMLREPVMFANAGIYAEAIFGSAVFRQELNRLKNVLRSLGYAQAPLHGVLPSLLGHLMLENGDPRLETFSVDLLLRGHAYRVESVARGVGKVSHGLAALGIIEKPLRTRNYRSWHVRTHQVSIPNGLHGAEGGARPRRSVPGLVKATIASSSAWAFGAPVRTGWRVQVATSPSERECTRAGTREQSVDPTSP